MKMTFKHEWCMKSRERRKERWTNLTNNNLDHTHAQHLPSLVSSGMISNLVSNSRFNKADMWELYLSRGFQGQIPQQISQHESRQRPSVIKSRGEQDKFPTSAAASASAPAAPSQEPGPSTPKQKKGTRWQEEEAEYEAEQEQFLPTEREEDSDFYGFDKEEENVEGDELNAGFSQPISRVVTSPMRPRRRTM
jgi:hypothetical protein